MLEDEILGCIRKATNAYEVYHKTSYECHRTAKNGEEQEVLVEILDAGSSVNPHLRYQCVATTKDGKLATGNPASSIEEVLSTVHWHQLDS